CTRCLYLLRLRLLFPLSSCHRLYHFIVYFSCHPLYLHSFPTRRSSDLVVFSFAVEEFGKAALLRAAYESRADPVVVREFYDHEADRKSTRLNSSHGSISYAVFCLKKKKNL